MPDVASAFDADGHVELSDYDVISAVFKESYLGQLGKWRGEIRGLPVVNGVPTVALELNPDPPREDRPGFTAQVGDHLQKMPFGVIMKITPEEYAEYQASLGL